MTDELRPAQIDDLAYLISHPRGGLFHDPAVGKTPPVCAYAWYVCDDLKEKVIIQQPKSIIKKNRDELLRFTPFKEDEVIILEEVPAAQRAIDILIAARDGKLRFDQSVDTKMLDVLKSTAIVEDKGEYRGDGVKLSKSAVKKAIKRGLVDGVTLKVIKQAEVWNDRYLIDKTVVSKSTIDELMECQVLTQPGDKGRIGLGPNAPDIAGLEAQLTFHDKKVFLMGFDYFANNWRWLKRYNPEINTDIVDEIHLGYSTHSSFRTGQLYEAHRYIKRFVPMTGTLINGRYDSAYPTIHIIEPRYYGSYENFMFEHAVKDIWGSVIGWKNPEKLAKVLNGIGRRRTFEEEYGPEAKVIIHDVCEMSPEQRAKYDEFHEKALLELEDEFLDGTLPGVATLRASQIMQCPEIFGLCKGETTGKDERIKIHLSESDGPCIVFGVFEAEQDRLVQLANDLGRKTALINHKVNLDRRAEIDRAFREGGIDTIVASPATAGVGFNWGRTRFMLFSSLDYQDGNFMQAYRRAIRGVRDQALLIYILEYENSIDQRKFAIIDRKAREAQLVDPTRQVFDLLKKQG